MDWRRYSFRCRTKGLRKALRIFKVRTISLHNAWQQRFFDRQRLCKRCGATILEDHHIISTGDENLLLLHGDTLCTDDAEYQQFRTLVRNKSWQEEFLSKTVEERRNFAQEARDKSKSETSLKSDSIMDVNQEEVLKLFQKYHVSKILHGHTHRPAIHELKVKSKKLSTQTAQRIVLGDWDERGWWAELYNNRLSLKSFALSND